MACLLMTKAGERWQIFRIKEAFFFLSTFKEMLQKRTDFLTTGVHIFLKSDGIFPPELPRDSPKTAETWRAVLLSVRLWHKVSGWRGKKTKTFPLFHLLCGTRSFPRRVRGSCRWTSVLWTPVEKKLPYIRCSHSPVARHYRSSKRSVWDCCTRSVCSGSNWHKSVWFFSSCAEYRL